MFLRIVPISIIPQRVLDTVQNELENINIKSRVMPKLSVPEDSFNRWRKQHNAEVILTKLANESAVKFIDKNIPTIMLIDSDLYFKGLSFVFSLENPTISCFIVSIARMRPEFYDETPNLNLLAERATKEVIHEVGHHLGLHHCDNRECVMNFSPSVGDIDSKQKYFCESCKINMMAKGIRL
ncbi:MAG: archaemetzincin family Zn-dependent metalloprotease [Candidatus Aenigmarchaeota archaeon]|nr:archaemetzincin family Zn-dependent metalloprotease [Candidatus Aenigmarchaeota archaeon]